jgi:hypothetical protein
MTSIARTRKNSNRKTAATTSSENVMIPVHRSHSYRSRYGGWRWSRRVRITYRTMSPTRSTSDAIHVGWNRSGKFWLVNGRNR